MWWFLFCYYVIVYSHVLCVALGKKYNTLLHRSIDSHEIKGGFRSPWGSVRFIHPFRTEIRNCQRKRNPSIFVIKVRIFKNIMPFGFLTKGMETRKGTKKWIYTKPNKRMNAQKKDIPKLGNAGKKESNVRGVKKGKRQSATIENNEKTSNETNKKKHRGKINVSKNEPAEKLRGGKYKSTPQIINTATDEIELESRNEQNRMENTEDDKVERERQKKIEFIKNIEHLLQEDEKKVRLHEKRENIENLRFGDKPPPQSESLMESILRNIHSKNGKEMNCVKNEDSEIKKKHLFYELFRISNSNTFKTYKIYTHKDLIYGMKYRKLGSSSLCVSELCIGTNMYENENFISKEDVNVLLNMAFHEYGINFFDICEYDPFPFDPDSYRKSKNKNMSLFLKDKKREHVIINLRMCSSRNVDELTHGEFYLSWIMEGIKGTKPTFYNLEERLDNILKRLNTDYVDILTIDLPERYLPNSAVGEDTYVWGFEGMKQYNEQMKEELHLKRTEPTEDKNESFQQKKNDIPINADTSVDASMNTDLNYDGRRKIPCISIEEQFDILEKLIQKGKVRYIAVSNESVWGLYEWCTMAKKKKKKHMKIVGVQNLYNLLHKNEVESSGLVEFILKENYDVPFIPYGLLAGGILTGKYLDPERYHTMGPDTVLGDDQLDHDLDESKGNKPEDYGYLSYGPKNGRCNKYPNFYKSHRCVWAQDAVGEYLKLARSHGMTLTQLSLSYVYSRPFVASSIIGPRTIGQLKDSILTLNYPLYKHLENDIHEIFLRYRGCTMDGNTILNSLKDPNKTSQTVFYKTANIPIVSGGTYWKNYPLPPLLKRYTYTDMKEERSRVESTFALNDIPNDSNFISSRIWVEREKNKGEYFALKESILFKWNKLKLHRGILKKLNKKEKHIYDTENFHFSFKNNTVSVIPTDEEIASFYTNEAKVKKVLQKTINDHQELYQYKDQLGHDIPSIFNNLDVDLIYKQLLNRHNINVLDKKQLDELYQYVQMTPSELVTEDFWYIYKYNPFDPSISVRTGMEQ